MKEIGTERQRRMRRHQRETKVKRNAFPESEIKKLGGGKMRKVENWKEKAKIGRKDKRN